MGIKLKIDIEEMTWEEMETIQDVANGQVDLRALRKLCAAHMIDERGEPVDVARAMKEIGRLKRAEMAEPLKALAEAIQIPPVSGGG